MELFDKILFPIKVVVAWIMVGFHAFFSTLGLDPAGGTAWALSIVGLVIVIRIILIPLFVRQIRAQRGLQLISPELQAIQKKYKGKTDPASREAMSRETMELYRKHGTNPFASCLPILAQSPIFFALFRVLYNLPRVAAGNYPTDGAGGSIGPITPDVAAHATNATIFGAPISSTFLSPEATTATRVVSVVLIVLMSVTTFTTQRQLTQKNMPASALQGPMAQQQKMLLYVLPLVFAVSGVNFPIGVLIYWTTTNLWSMGQQFYVIRRNPTPGSEAERQLKERQARKAAAKGIVIEDDQPAIEEKPRGQRQQPKRKDRAKGGQRPGSPADSGNDSTDEPVDDVQDSSDDSGEPPQGAKGARPGGPARGGAASKGSQGRAGAGSSEGRCRREAAARGRLVASRVRRRGWEARRAARRAASRVRGPRVRRAAGQAKGPRPSSAGAPAGRTGGRADDVRRVVQRCGPRSGLPAPRGAPPRPPGRRAGRRRVARRGASPPAGGRGRRGQRVGDGGSEASWPPAQAAAPRTSRRTRPTRTSDSRHAAPDRGDTMSDETAPRSTEKLEEEGDIAADYLEELLDITDLDGDIDIDVDHGRASLAIVAEGAAGRSLRRLVGAGGRGAGRPPGAHAARGAGADRRPVAVDARHRGVPGRAAGGARRGRANGDRCRAGERRACGAGADEPVRAQGRARRGGGGRPGQRQRGCRAGASRGGPARLSAVAAMSDVPDKGPASGGVEADPLASDPRVEAYLGDAFARVSRFGELLTEEGVRRGLIGPREVPRLWERHLLNSAALAPLLPADGVSWTSARARACRAWCSLRCART